MNVPIGDLEVAYASALSALCKKEGHQPHAWEVVERRSTKHPPWTDETRAELFRLRARGMKHAEIAAHMGRSLKSIECQFACAKRRKAA